MALASSAVVGSPGATRASTGASFIAMGDMSSPGTTAAPDSASPANRSWWSSA